MVLEMKGGAECDTVGSRNLSRAGGGKATGPWTVPVLSAIIKSRFCDVWSCRFLKPANNTVTIILAERYLLVFENYTADGRYTK